MKFACIALLALCAVTVEALTLTAGQNIHLKTCYGGYVSVPNTSTIGQASSVQEQEVFTLTTSFNQVGLKA